MASLNYQIRIELGPGACKRWRTWSKHEANKKKVMIAIPRLYLADVACKSTFDDERCEQAKRAGWVFGAFLGFETANQRQAHIRLHDQSSL